MKSLAISLSVLLFVTLNTAGPKEPSYPRGPRRGEQILLDKKNFPIENWKSKSKPNFPWFVEKPSGWYIDWDAERGLLTHFIVHHTAGPLDQTPGEISNFHRERLYKPVYDDQNYDTPYVNGLPIHSGHIVDGSETDIAYHYLIYPNGETRTTLVPYREVNGKWYVDMIGWGAGNWKINCQAVQVALVGTYTNGSPSAEALRALDNLATFYRMKIPNLVIAGHNEVRPRPTECPGDWFSSWVRKYKKGR